MSITDLVRPRTAADPWASTWQQEQTPDRVRTPRDNLEPAMLVLLVFLAGYAVVLLWQVVPAGHPRAMLGALVMAGLTGSCYLAATYGTRR